MLAIYAGTRQRFQAHLARDIVSKSLLSTLSVLFPFTFPHFLRTVKNRLFVFSQEWHGRESALSFVLLVPARR